MREEEIALPKSVTKIHFEDKECYLIGTAHVSKESVEDVKKTIEAVKPQTVCVELCAPRKTALLNRDSWKKMDIFQVIREGKAAFLLAQLIMSSFYKKIGDNLGVKPGAEMVEAIKMAQDTDAEIVLADREIEITLKRVWRYLSFWNKLKMLSHMLGSFFMSEEVDEEMINELKDAGKLDSVMEQFAQAFPQTKERLIDERDIYLSQMIRTSKGNPIVAVVGAGHVKGIKENIQTKIPLAPLEEIPPPSVFSKVIKWIIPLIIIALFIIGFKVGGAQEGIQSLVFWVVSHSLLAALGAALAFSHLFTVLVAAVVAPFTSLNPLVAAGWVAGLAQAWIKRPTVEDLEHLPQDILSISGFWRNPATRVLLTVILTNLGSTIATFISGSWIISQIIN